MATDLQDLREALDGEVGTGKATADLDRWLRLGVGIYNARSPKVFTTTNNVLDRDASEVEKRALVLFGVISYIDQKLMEASENAIKHSNVAGKIDLSGVEFALGKRRRELFEQQIDPLMKRINGAAVVADIEVNELGETKNFTSVTSTSTA